MRVKQYAFTGESDAHGRRASDGTELRDGAGAPRRPIRILHVDHSDEPGGAELALARLLATNTRWAAMLSLPRRSAHGESVPGAFDAPALLPITQRTGPAHSPGATQLGGSPRQILALAWQVVASAVALRTSEGFRRAEVLALNSSRAAVVGTIAGLFARRRPKVVVHLRDETSPASLGRAGFLVYSRFVLPRADAVIANSSHTLKSAEQYIAKPTIRAIIASPIGLERATLAKMPTKPFKTVGMVARIDPWKGQHLALDAFARAFRGTSVRLVFAGGAYFDKDKYLAQLHRIARELSIADQVDFVGHVDDVATIVGNFDLAIQSSTRPEPLGQNVLQYLACATPTIAWDEGGPREWITHLVNGVLVAPRDTNAMADWMMRIAGDERLRLSLSQGALETPGLLTDGQCVVAHARLYESLLDDVNRSSLAQGGGRYDP